MRLLSTFLFVLLGVLAVVAVVVMVVGDIVAERQAVSPRIKFEAPIGEDPAGRAYFEWLRQHDPATGRIPTGIRAKELRFAKTLPTREFIAFHKQDDQDLEWISRGPFGIGGRTRALGIDRADPRIINAGGVSGGMWRSDDDGQSWTKTTRPDQHHSVTTLIQDPRPGHSNVWLYGSGEFAGNSAQAPGAPYLGTGLYISDDNGRSWTRAGFADEDPEFNVTFDAFYNLAIDPSNTGERELYAATYGLIYKTTNEGADREPRLVDDPENPTFSTFTDVVVTDEGVVYAALSSDGGMGGLWRSPDGDDFTEITPAGFPAVFNRVVMALSPSEPKVVYFLGETPGTGTSNHSLWKYTYASGDGSGEGGSWEDLSPNIPDAKQFDVASNFPDDLGAFDSQGGYDLVIAVKPDDPDVVFIGGTNLYRSDNGFTSADETYWIGGYHPARFIYPSHHPDLHAIVFYPDNPDRMLTGDDGGIHRTENNTFRLTVQTPVEWDPLNTGYRTSQFYSVAIDESATDDHVIVGGMQDNGTAFTNDQTGTRPWIGDILGGDGAFADISEGKDYFYVSSQNAQIFRMELDERGGTVSRARVDPPEQDFGVGLFVTPFHLDPIDQAKMYLGGGSGIWRNENLLAIPNGNQEETSLNWVVLTETVGQGDVVTAVKPTAVPSTSTRLYYATINTSASGSVSGVFRLEDAHEGDPAPIEITQGPESGRTAMPEGAYVSCIAVHPSNPDVAMITFSNYGVRSVFYTDDAGATWTDVSGNLEESPDGDGDGPSVRWAEILPISGGVMYFVATSTGVYSTTLLGGEKTIWLQEGATAIGNVVVDMLDSRPTDHLVVAATHGNGIYSARAAIEVGTEGLEAAGGFELSSAYPNPFRASTGFDLRLAHDQEVAVDVFDEIGRRVTTLHDGWLTANAPHRFEFQARGLSSGVYTIRVRGESIQRSLSAVLVR